MPRRGRGSRAAQQQERQQEEEVVPPKAKQAKRGSRDPERDEERRAWRVEISLTELRRATVRCWCDPWLECSCGRDPGPEAAQETVAPRPAADAAAAATGAAAATASSAGSQPAGA